MDDNKLDKKKDEYIFGLDIGASKINLFVGVSEGESVRVVECGDFPLKNADDLDSVVETLQQAVQVIENTTLVPSLRKRLIMQAGRDSLFSI